MRLPFTEIKKQKSRKKIHKDNLPEKTVLLKFRMMGIQNCGP